MKPIHWYFFFVKIKFCLVCMGMEQAIKIFYIWNVFWNNLLEVLILEIHKKCRSQCIQPKTLWKTLKKTIIQMYNGQEGPLFSSMVSCEVFSESDVVLGRSNSFRKFLDSSRKSKTVLGNLKQLSEFLNSSPKSQTVLGNLKQLSEVLDSSRKF